MYSTFGFGYQVILSTRPAKFLGKIEEWNQAEEALKKALEIFGKPYKINEGDGAFYGPKIDILLNDSLGRPHQLSTV